MVSVTCFLGTLSCLQLAISKRSNEDEWVSSIPFLNTGWLYNLNKGGLDESICLCGKDLPL